MCNRCFSIIHLIRLPVREDRQPFVLYLLAQSVEFFLLLLYQRKEAVVLLIEFFLPVLADGVFAVAMGLFQVAQLVGMVETEAQDESVAVVEG